jgi:multicomponent Na+:H+ antiporter subunit C
VAKGNLVKKIVGLNIFQTSIFMLYISMGKITGGTAPIFPVDMDIDPDVIYTNPLPHVLILTAIVVGVATTALGLALIVRIREEFNTINEDDIVVIEQALARDENERYHKAMGDQA